MFDLMLVVLVIVLGFALVFVVLYKEMKKVVNFGPKDALVTCLELISKSRDEIKIVSDLLPNFFNDERVLMTFSDALSRGVKFKILYDPQARSYKYVKKFARLSKEYPDKILIRKMKQAPPYHFWIGDKIHLRLEEPHPYRDIRSVKGEIYYNTVRLASHYNKIFNSEWIK